MIYRIGKELIFPQPVDVEPDGLLCIGGDLSVDRLLLAYSHGIFPWFSFRDYDEPLWYCPQERFVIFPNEIHVSHSMRTLINKGKYDVSIGDDFDSVIRGCQKADGRYDSEGAWLSEDIINAYTELHRQNLAQNGQIVVALIGDEATVKTLKRKGSEVWLMPANPDYQPIDGRECTILGRVVAVVRQY